ncbi:MULTISPECIES: MarR family winged helix-turn-helix transcriptional regulator [Microbacterium]|uniref:MarR family transcriptional regulator n=1 Tax=Microbacterium sufflavum TaxID=2851649 RepID=A0ABY4IF76_9MICO|nr:MULTISPECIES: MarR family transcriptional regulator [Microbacterium]MBN6191182.1 MarR family transcriptional regulator [Aneurinibacillus sp. BA2021]UPL10797.1 MarR family transcriptional regulator [Microbacterium sufflavum]
MGKTSTDVATSSLARDVDDFRRADAQLNRRLAARREPNDTDRAAMHFIGTAPAERPLTPRDLAGFLGISTAAVTSVIRRLSERGQIVVAPHPLDARSKVLRPSLRDLHSQGDELSVRVAALADEFTEQEAAAISRFLRRLTDELGDLP